MPGRWHAISRLVPRKYQQDATELAIKEGRLAVVMPTGTGKTLIALLFAEHHLKEGRKVLVLEPTRILVEQTYHFFREHSRYHPLYYHSLERNPNAFQHSLVITTPESALLNNIEDFEVLIVDECHHVSGRDPLRILLERSDAPYRLGLTSFIPRRNKKLVEELIGRIVVWSHDHPDIREYVAPWIGEVWETPLPEEEWKLYKLLEEGYLSSSGRTKLVFRWSMVYLSRDGNLALLETVERAPSFSIVREVVKESYLSPHPHKLSHLKDLLREDFEKSIVFVERTVIARKVAEEVGAALITGRKSIREKREELERARRASVIVSTSAGEEGIDLPTADLLVIWSNTSSVLRFIQRRGRVLRKEGNIPKRVVFLVTPNTLDMDTFVEGVHEAERYGVDVGVLKDMAQRYVTSGRRSIILRELRTPRTLEELARVTGLPLSVIRRDVRIFRESGELVIVFTERGRSYLSSEGLVLWAEREKEYFEGGGDLHIKTRERRKTPPLYIESATVREKRGEVEYVYSTRLGFLVKDERVLSLLLKHYSTPRVYRTWN